MDSLDQAIHQYEQAYKYERDRLVKTSVVLNIAEVSIMNKDYEKSLASLDKIEIGEWVIGAREDNSNLCLYLYLRIAAKYLLNQNIDGLYSILENYLNDNTLTGWSYTTFEKWIKHEDNGLSNPQIKYLSDLTQLMEERTRDY
jgi:hypothetical protein